MKLEIPLATTHPAAYRRLWSLGCAVVVLAWLPAAQGAAELAVIAQRGGGFENAVVTSDYAYVGQGATVVTVALTTSGTAKEAGEVRFTAPLPGVVQDLAIHGDTLYVSWDGRFSDVQLTRFSLADPSQPTPIGEFEVPGGGTLFAKGLAVVDDILYILTGSDLLSFDLTGPTPVPGTPVGLHQRHIRHHGQDQLLACGLNVIGSAICRIYDISSPLAPAYLGFFHSSFNPSGGNGFAVSYMSVGFWIWDLTDPSDPRLATSVSGFAANSGAILGDHLLVSGEGTIRPWDLSDPLNPIAEGTVPAPIEVARVTEADPISGTTAFLTGFGRLVQVDASFPAVPAVDQVFELPVGVSPRRIAALGSELLLVGEARGLSRLDAKLATLDDVDSALGLGPDAEIRDVSTDGSRALVTAGSAGLYLVDFQAPDSPVILGTVPLSNPWTAVLQGNRAWALDIVGPPPWEYHLLALDLSNPAAPRVTGVQQVSGLAKLHLDGDLLYVADSGLESGLRIFDVSGARLVPLGIYDDCLAFDVDVRQDLAAVTCTGSRVHLLDVGNSASPTLLGVYDPGQYVGFGAVFFDHDGALLFGYRGGVDVLDVIDPSQPRLSERIEIGGLVSQIIEASGGGVWVVAEHGGVARIQESGFLVAPQGLDTPLARR